MPYLCWIYNNDTQQKCTGIHTCAVDMLNGLPTDKDELLLIAHNSDYDCRCIFQYLRNPKPIIKGRRFLQTKEAYYNPIVKQEVKSNIKDSYKFIPMALTEFGKSFNQNFF